MFWNLYKKNQLILEHVNRHLTHKKIRKIEIWEKEKKSTQGNDE